MAHTRAALVVPPVLLLLLLARPARAQPQRVSGPPVVPPFMPSIPAQPTPLPPPASPDPSTQANLPPSASGSPVPPITISGIPSFPSPSPARRAPRPVPRKPAPVCTSPFRALDGTCTTLNIALGAANRAQFSYGTAKNARFPTSGLPSARLVSNIVCSQVGDILSRRRLSEMVTFMGQFLDHSIIATPVVAGQEFNIPIPQLDPVFANFSGGVFPFERSLRTLNAAGKERPVNELSSAIDLTSVYGPKDARLDKLRAKVGGRMLTSAGNLLPLNRFGLNNAPSKSADFFVAGDRRVNENPVLTSLHTLFLREHNRLARDLQRTFPYWTDEKLFQNAKLLNTAQYQKIIFDEYYPVMTGRRLPRYRGFQRNVNPTVSDVFGAMAFRVGHTMVGNQINRRGPRNVKMAPIPFMEMFFRKNGVLANGIEPFIRGAIFEKSQEVDVFVVDALRNFLFTNVPQERGFDLMALNLQRSRDHTLPLYNELRVLFGRRPARSFRQITRNRALQSALHSAYGSVDRVEGIVGIFAEDHVRRASMGRTMLLMWKAEFTRLRDGDRFFFERLEAYPTELRRYRGLRRLLWQRNTFKKVILRNTNIRRRDIRGSVWKSRIRGNPYRG